MTITRSRRLRKKLYLEEFRQLGFEISFRLAGDREASERESFWDRFIVEAIEANGLVYGGSESGGFITGRGRETATEDQRLRVVAWLTARPMVSSVAAGELVDAWSQV